MAPPTGLDESLRERPRAVGYWHGPVTASTCSRHSSASLTTVHTTGFGLSGGETPASWAPETVVGDVEFVFDFL